MSSYVPIIASTAGASAAAAAAARARKEEEEMTKYNNDDLDGWEFKIMRSTWGSFGNREKLTQVCEEEAAAGWEMVEKFDNHRVRFKRRIERRANDRHQPHDPYRTSPGGSSSSGKTLMVIGGGLALLLGLLLAVGVFSLVVFPDSGGISFSSGSAPWMLITVAGLAIVGLGVAVMLKKK